MGILKISYENVKSIKDGYLTFSDLNILLGRNGAGKTNLQKYINYYFNNLTNNNIDIDIFDKQNPYNDFSKISVEYDCNDVLKIGNDQHEIFQQIISQLDDKKRITISLTQYKNNEITWSHSYNVRKVIKYLFPIYFIDVRNINLLDWENIWDLVGDLGQKRSKQEESLQIGLDSLLRGTYGDRYIGVLNSLKNELKVSGYDVSPFTNSEKFKQLYKFIFGGEKFKYQENSLNFYSSGFNSFNYIRIFYLILNLLHKDKLKHPLVILDEPEIGLHPTLIDELVEFISSSDGRISSLISTHSSRIIKNSIVLNKVNLFQVTEKNKKTTIRKIKRFEDEKLSRVITDKEASYYFSNGILFVEGVSEYELFTNKILRDIFPILKKIEIFSYNSNNISLDISHPYSRKLDIPHLLLLDSDKILTYSVEKQKFSITGDSYNPLKNEEIARIETFFYGEMRVFQHWRNRIKGISKKVEFNADKNTFTFNDQLFEEFRLLVKNYCISCGVYPVETTIEGVLINKNNYNLFYDWVMSENSDYDKKENIEKAYNMSNEIDYKINVLRILVEGKLDTLNKLKEDHLSNIENIVMRDGYKIILSSPKIQKGSGWVSKYVTYVHSKNENEASKFLNYFPELNDIMKSLEYVMK